MHGQPLMMVETSSWWTCQDLAEAFIVLKQFVPRWYACFDNRNFKKIVQPSSKQRHRLCINQADTCNFLNNSTPDSNPPHSNVQKAYLVTTKKGLPLQSPFQHLQILSSFCSFLLFLPFWGKCSHDFRYTLKKILINVLVRSEWTRDAVYVLDKFNNNFFVKATQAISSLQLEIKKRVVFK